jgi:hypothetical protein
MFGIHDPWIISAYLACILSAVICVVYGLINWNRGGEDEVGQMSEEARWEETEREVESKL